MARIKGITESDANDEVRQIIEVRSLDAAKRNPGFFDHPRFRVRFIRATPRADIRIHGPTGDVCLGNRLTKRDLLMDMAANFGFLHGGAAEYTGGRAGSRL